MPEVEITPIRLHNQLIAHSKISSPVEVVRWLVAVQSQDYPAAKWAVGLRTPAATDAEIERAFDEGAILRTHVLRPTWHFVTPADIRWMLALTAPRVKAGLAYNLRRLELDRPILSRANSVLENALQGGKQLTRQEVDLRLRQAGIITAKDEPLRFLHVMISAELDGIVCSGTRRGKQHTYALLEERASHVPMLDRESALAELARRYFTSRGPASVKDFSWWSGLSGVDAKAGLEMIKPIIVEEVIDGQSYWLVPSSSSITQETTPAVHLLPNYDEYMVSYTNRSAIYDPGKVQQGDERANSLLNNAIVIDGQVEGMWKREFRKGGVEIKLNLFSPISDAENQALNTEMVRFSRFLEMPQIIQ
jgi:hypothetical protein